MAKGLSIRMKFETLRSLAFGSIGAAYAAVGTSFDHPIRFTAITNLTDAAMYFSFDGVNDHLVLPANGFIVLDVTTNKSQSQGLYIAENDRLYVKQVGAPSSGSVYCSAMYGA